MILDLQFLILYCSVSCPKKLVNVLLEITVYVVSSAGHPGRRGNAQKKQHAEVRREANDVEKHPEKMHQD
jgi:hypothetical protein